MTYPRPCTDCGQGFEAKTKAAKFGPCCLWKYRRRRAKYADTPATDAVIAKHYEGYARGRKRRAAIALGWPEWKVQRRAVQMGYALKMARQDWTRPEVAFLILHLGSRPVSWFEKKLKRTQASIVLKIKRLRLSRKFTEGFTLRALCDGFGEDHKRIREWEQRGWLHVERLPEPHAAHVKGAGGP